MDCQPGWDYFNSSCYQFRAWENTWAINENVCVEENAHLASIHSDEDVEFVLSIVYKSTFPHLIWTGGRRRNENSFSYSDGTMLDYKNWAFREPDNHGGNEDCIAMYYGGPDKGKLADVSCSDNYIIVCKKPSPGNVSATL